MKNLDADLAALLAARRGLAVRMLVWIVVSDRTTGAPVSIGFANDVQPVALTVDGEARTYQAAGGALAIEPVVTESGLVVRMLKVTLSGVAPEVALAMRGYDPRLAPVTIHRQVLDPATGAVIGGSLRLFKGVVDQVSLPTPQKNGRVDVSVTVVSAARELTRRLALKKSNESQRRRTVGLISPTGDLFRRYADISGEVPVWWGAKRLDPPVAAAPVASPAQILHPHSDR